MGDRPRHRRRRLHRLARRRRAAARRATTVRVVDALLPAAHRERPGYLDPAAEWIDGDLRDPDGRDARGRRRRARVPPGGDGRARRRPRRPARVRRPQRPRHRAAAARARRARLRRPASCSRRAWSSTARAATRAPSTASSRPAPRAPPTSTPAASSRPARAAAARSRRSTVPGGRAGRTRAASTPRRSSRRSTCARAFARETGVPVTALRYHNVYGPRMPRDTPYAGVASIFRSAYAAGRAPRVFEDGGQRRDFVHVRDVARANLLALTAPEPVAGAFNVASGTPRTVLEMAHALAARLRGAAGPRRSSPASGGRATCATSSPRPRAPPSGSASARRRTSRPGWRSSPPRRCGLRLTPRPRAAPRRARQSGHRHARKCSRSTASCCGATTSASHQHAVLGASAARELAPAALALPQVHARHRTPRSGACALRIDAARMAP